MLGEDLTAFFKTAYAALLRYVYLFLLLYLLSKSISFEVQCHEREMGLKSDVWNNERGRPIGRKRRSIEKFISH